MTSINLIFSNIVHFVHLNYSCMLYLQLYFVEYGQYIVNSNWHSKCSLKSLKSSLIKLAKTRTNCDPHVVILTCTNNTIIKNNLHICTQFRQIYTTLYTLYTVMIIKFVFRWSTPPLHPLPQLQILPTNNVRQFNKDGIHTLTAYSKIISPVCLLDTETPVFTFFPAY